MAVGDDVGDGVMAVGDDVGDGVMAVGDDAVYFMTEPYMAGSYGLKFQYSISGIEGEIQLYCTQALFPTKDKKLLLELPSMYMEFEKVIRSTLVVAFDCAIINEG